MKLKPISLKDANLFVIKHHRHHGRVVGYKFAIGVEVNGELKGVAICSRPVAPKSDNGLTLEISRLCVVDTPNACSRLYSACARVAKEMGYDKIQTFILESETGTSLKASGWFCELEKAGGKAWNSSGDRIRFNESTDMFGNTTKKYPTEMKRLFVKYLSKKSESVNYKPNAKQIPTTVI